MAGVSWFKVESIFLRTRHGNFILQIELNSVTLSPTNSGWVGKATLDRPKYYAVTLLTTLGYRMEF